MFCTGLVPQKNCYSYKQMIPFTPAVLYTYKVGGVRPVSTHLTLLDGVTGASFFTKPAGENVLRAGAAEIRDNW